MPKRRVGQRNDAFTLNIDLAPTILAAADVEMPERMQGRDMADIYVRSYNDWRKEFLYEYWDDNDVREETEQFPASAFSHFLFGSPHHQDIPNSMALVKKDFKVIHWTDHNYTQLFDLASDPYEERDLFSSTSKETVDQYRRQMEEMRQATRNGARL